MHLLLEKAKSGDITAKFNNLYIHSAYDPRKEAKRFVENIKISYAPPYIIITEPGLGYCIPLLREKYPKSKIIIIRYSPEFSKYNDNADYIFNFFNTKSSLNTQLSNLIKEEDLINSLFIQWPSSSRIFSELEKEVIKEIKISFQNAKTLLITREFYEKKWLLNAISFTAYAENLINLNKKIDKPILIISSGPSLKPVIEIIKANKDKFFIITLSSAIKTCLANKITPNLIMTTDGGFWAGQHLKVLNKFNIPVAMPLEGYVPRTLLKKLQILPLDYGDGISSKIINKINLQTCLAERNGTVSGTALKFAIDYSDKEIYFCGLDMSNQKGFQHCQPNEITINNNLKYNYINNNEKQAVRAQFSSSVLNIYKEWFINLDTENRKIYRIIDKQYKNNSLGNIEDIDSKKFLNVTKTIKNEKNNKNYFSDVNWNKNLSTIMSLINKLSKNSTWNNYLYPLSMTTLFHDNQNFKILNRIKNENIKLINKIRKLLNE